MTCFTIQVLMESMNYLQRFSMFKLFSLVVYLLIIGAQIIQCKKQEWLPVNNCPWGKNEEAKSYEKCDRGKINLYNFRKHMKQDFYKLLGGSQNEIVMHIEPVVVKSKYSNSLFCMLDKCGSTAWSRVIHKAMGQSSNKVNGNDLQIYSLPIARIGKIQPAEQKILLDSPEVVRWMIVRNPYARLFSSYFEKLVKGRPWEVKCYQQLFQLYDEKNESYYPSFEEFVYQLYTFYNATSWNAHTQRKPKSLSALNGADRHFDLQTSRCDMIQGLGWDYVLKSELVQEWYPILINTLNFTDVVMSGWPNENQCFMSTPARKCDGPTLGGTQDGSKSQKQLHTLKSKEHMLKSYNKEIAALVTEMFLPDIIGLNYPLWDGNPDTFSIV